MVRRTRRAVLATTIAAAMCWTGIPAVAGTDPEESPGVDTATSVDGLDALAALGGDVAAEQVADLIGDTVVPDGSIAVTEQTLTALPTTDDTSVETVSLVSGETVSFDVEGLDTVDHSGGAVTGDLDHGRSVMVHATDNGVQIVAVIEAAATTADLAMSTEVPAGATWHTHEDGGLRLVGTDGQPIMVVDAPWALDADGKELPTSFSVEGGTITQHVDTTGAAFPVVADPSAWWWVSTTAQCVAGVATIISPLAASKVATALAKAVTLINKSATAKKALSALGGIKPALGKVVQYVKDKTALTVAQRKSVENLIKFGGSTALEVLGIGGCWSLVNELRK